MTKLAVNKMRKKFSCYEYETWEYWPDLHRDKCLGYCYTIFGAGCPPYDDGKILSDEWYDSAQQAEFAAIGHITLLENGEG